MDIKPGYLASSEHRTANNALMPRDPARDLN